MTEHATVKVARSSREGGPSRPAGLLRFYPLGDPPQVHFHPLSSRVTVIGRSDSCAIQVEDDQVSRRHALLEGAGNAWRIGDCESANGLFVDGHRVSEHTLRGGEVVRVGGTLFRYIPAAHHVSFDEATSCTEGLVGGPALAETRDRLLKAAPSDLAVLVTGETGTGKEVAARYLHAHGPSRSGPFIAVNCAAIPFQLVESELFGHVKGAFTGATVANQGLIRRAHGGTLFFDEIGELPLESQPKLLRVLQERTVQPVGGADPVPVDVRLVSATNRDLLASVEEGLFRADLYARIAEIEVRLPPLRERIEDVPLLVQHFLAKHGGAPETSAELMELLCLRAWRFNVRELESVIRRALVIAADAPRLEPEHILGGDAAEPPSVRAPARGEDAGPPSAERTELEDLLRKHEGDVDRAAATLGISRSQLYRRAQRLGIRVSDFRE